MKIKELLDLTKTEKPADIAKNRLEFGDKKLREILKGIGAIPPPVGKSGWTYNGDPAVLEKDISEFSPKKATPRKANNKKETQKTNKKETNISKNPENNDIIISDNQERNKTNIKETHPSNKVEIRQFEQPIPQETRKPVKKVTYEVDENLHFEFRMKAFRLKRNVSELVEQAMREFLDK